jgi:hypothetical protein
LYDWAVKTKHCEAFSKAVRVASKPQNRSSKTSMAIQFPSIQPPLHDLPQQPLAAPPLTPVLPRTPVLAPTLALPHTPIVPSSLILDSPLNAINLNALNGFNRVLSQDSQNYNAVGVDMFPSHSTPLSAKRFEQEAKGSTGSSSVRNSSTRREPLSTQEKSMHFFIQFSHAI